MSSVRFSILAVAVGAALGVAACATGTTSAGGGRTSNGINLGMTGPHPVQPLSHKPRLARPISEADVAAWNIDIRAPDGKGLPPGRGTVAEGEKIYDARCAACHGPEAKGGPMYGSMVGGIGSFRTDKRVVTPGSMYPYAPILFDYIRRSMPLDAPQTLTANETYAVSAYMLHVNGLLPAEGAVDQTTLARVKMPNRDGFLVDDRPDVRAQRCMTNCK